MPLFPPRRRVHPTAHTVPVAQHPPEVSLPTVPPPSRAPAAPAPFTQQHCPACSAPLLAPDTARHVRCTYCGSNLAVTRSGADVSLELATRVTDTVTRASDQTRAELQRMAARQEIAALEMRLQTIEAEIRTLKRSERTSASRRQVADLNRSADALEEEIYQLRVSMDPQLVHVLERPAYHNWGYGGPGWIFGELYGRVGRVAYWVALPIGLLGALIFTVSLQALGDAWRSGDFAPFTLVLVWIGLMMLWGYIAVTVKRYHDMDRTGLWVLIATVPVLGFLWQFAECAFLPGTSGPNRFE